MVLLVALLTCQTGMLKVNFTWINSPKSSGGVLSSI